MEIRLATRAGFCGPSRDRQRETCRHRCIRISAGMAPHL